MLFKNHDQYVHVIVKFILNHPV